MENLTVEPVELDLDPFNDEFLSDPYTHHHTLREAGPVVWLPAIGAFAMARYAEVQASLKDWQTFVSSRGVGLSDFSKEKPWRAPSLLLETDPPVHDRTRGLMNPIVSLVRLKELRPLWAAEAEKLIDDLVSKGRFDAVTDLAEVFPMRIFPPTIGLPVEGRENLLVYASMAFNAFGPKNALFEQSHAAAAGAIEWVAKACSREALTPGGWGSAVYDAADRGVCSEDEAERLVRSFLTAGVDTTVNGIGNMLAAFVQFPEEWEKLRNDPNLIKRAFEESLRWDSTVQTFFRTTARDVTVAGVRIPEGAKVLLFLAAANRDPRRWPDAEKFDVNRVASGHVGFGFGIHQCLGQMVARLEAEVILEALLKRVKSFKPAGAPKRRLNNTLHALASLPVEVEAL